MKKIGGTGFLIVSAVFLVLLLIHADSEGWTILDATYMILCAVFFVASCIMDAIKGS
jgi:hypothetical protein